MNASDIDDLVARHLAETSGTNRDCSVSDLARGECTRRDYYIFKLDLANSTTALKTQRPAIYARVAHAHLSTVDRITREWGAEPEQTEYHGDSVLAFFPERGNTSEGVLTAAIQSHYAVNRLRHTVNILALRPRILLHFAQLTVAKIGPWSESHRVAIGIPIHLVAHKEKSIEAPTIWVSDEFARQLRRDVRDVLLVRRTIPVTTTEMVPAPPPPLPPTLSDLGGAFGAPVDPLQRLASVLARKQSPDPSLLDIGAIPLNSLLGVVPPPAGASLLDLPSLAPRTVAKEVTRQQPDGYTVNLVRAYQELRLPLKALSG